MTGIIICSKNFDLKTDHSKPFQNEQPEGEITSKVVVIELNTDPKQRKITDMWKTKPKKTGEKTGNQEEINLIVQETTQKKELPTNNFEISFLNPLNDPYGFESLKKHISYSAPSSPKGGCEIKRFKNEIFRKIFELDFHINVFADLLKQKQPFEIDSIPSTSENSNLLGFKNQPQNMEDDNQVLKAQINLLTNEMAIIASILNSDQNKIEDLLTIVGASTKKVRDLAKLLEEINKTPAENSNLLSKIEGIIRREESVNLGTIQKEMKDMCSKSDSLLENQNVFNEQIKGLQAQCNALQSEITNLEANFVQQILVTESRYFTFTELILKKLINQIVNEILDINSKNKDVQKDHSDFNNRFDKLSEEQENLKTQNAELKNRLEEQSRIIKQILDNQKKQEVHFENNNNNNTNKVGNNQTKDPKNKKEGGFFGGFFGVLFGNPSNGGIENGSNNNNNNGDTGSKKKKVVGCCGRRQKEAI